MWIDRRGLIAVIAGSVLLNLFLLGLVVSHLSVEHRPVDRALVPDARVQALPAQDRTRYEAVMQAHKPAIVSARRAHQASRNALEAELAAPSFDAARVKAAFEALRKARETLQEQTQAALAEALAGLPATSRAALFAR